MAKQQNKRFIIKEGHEDMGILPPEVEQELLSSKNITGPDYYIVRASSNNKTLEEIDSLAATVSSKTETSMCTRYETARREVLSKGYTAKEFKSLVENLTLSGIKGEPLVESVVKHVSSLPEKQSTTSTNANEYLKNVIMNPKDARAFDAVVSRIIDAQIKKHIQDHGQIEKNHQVAYVLGSAAAGKSTTIKALRDTMKAFPADQDRLKSDISKELGTDINDPSMQKLAKIAMEKLITYLKEQGYNYIHEKVGDEPNKMLKLFKESVDAGYEMQLHCVHADNSVCRVRNQNRCVGLINDGEPARAVPDDVVQDMGNKALSTYLFVMKNYGEYFTEGHCYCSDTSTDPNVKRNPQELLTLAHGEYVNERIIQQYIQAGTDAFNQTFRAAKAQLINKLKEQSQATLQGQVEQFEPLGRQFETSPLREIQALFEAEMDKIMVKVFSPHLNYRGNQQYNPEQTTKQIEEVIREFDIEALISSMVSTNEKVKSQNPQTPQGPRREQLKSMESELEETTKNM